MSASPVVDLNLSFNFDGRNDLLYHLLESFTLHILYIRSVFPQPFVDLLKHEKELLQATKLSSPQRKKLKIIHDVKCVLSCLKFAVKNFTVKTAALLLGPSANNPKETYNLHFVASNTNTGSNTAPMLSEKHFNVAKRHLIHRLIEYNCNETSTTTPTRASVFIALNVVVDNSSLAMPSRINPHSMHVACHVPSFMHALEISAGGGAPPLDTSVEDDADEVDIFQFFSFKDSFKQREDKVVPVKIQVQTIAAATEAPSAGVGAETEVNIDPSAADATTAAPKSSNNRNKNMSRRRPLGRRRPPAFHLRVQSKDAAIAAAAEIITTEAETGAAVADAEAAAPNPSATQQVATRWLVLNRGIKSIPA